MVVMLLAAHSSAQAYSYTTFNDGAFHSISDNTYEYHGLTVSDSEDGAGTTLVVSEGAGVGYTRCEGNTNYCGGSSGNSGWKAGDLDVRGDSAVFFSGGQLGKRGYVYSRSHEGGGVLRGHDSASINVTGGSVRYVELNGSSTLNMAAGTVRSDFNANGSGVANVYGGNFENSLYARDNAVLNFAGGSLNNNATSSGEALLNLQGGQVGGTAIALEQSTLTLSAGDVAGILEAQDSSTFNLSGGSTASTFTARDTSSFAMSAGTVGGDFHVRNIASGTVSGGVVNGNLLIRDAATVDISGGAVAGDSEFLDTVDITMSGGSLGGDLSVSHFADVELEGGEISGDLYLALFANVSVSETLIDGHLDLADISVLEIDGWGFTLDGVNLGYANGTGGLITALSGTLSGYLRDGRFFENTFSRSAGSTLSVVTPEPGTALLLGIGLMGLAGARRRL